MAANDRHPLGGLVKASHLPTRGEEVVAGVFTTYSLEPDFFEEEIVTLLGGPTRHKTPRFGLSRWKKPSAQRLGRFRSISTLVPWAPGRSGSISGMSPYESLPDASIPK